MNNKNRQSKRQIVALPPALPAAPILGALKDLAHDVIRASTALESAVAPKTAAAIGEKLRVVNSYHSNLIEGYKTTIYNIEQALERKFSGDDQERYAQELCVAHVKAERKLMPKVLSTPGINVGSTEFLCGIHREFYSQLPARHRFTHSQGGFTSHPVCPGVLRDYNVSVGRTPIGPEPADLPAQMQRFSELFDPATFHGGEEKLIAAATGHCKLAWLHPFRDGNGRVVRLYSGLYMAQAGINRASLWSLSRGLSQKTNEYMTSLFASNPQPKAKGEAGAGLAFKDENIALFAEFFLETCRGQIRDMEGQLSLRDLISRRIERYVQQRGEGDDALRPETSRLLRAVFIQGEVQRGEAQHILNLGQRTSRKTVSNLVTEGLLESKSSKAPLTIGLPSHVLPHYFPGLFNEATFGPEYLDTRPKIKKTRELG